MQALALSRKGLEARGMGEEVFLAPLEEIGRTGVTRADAMREKYETEWNKSVDPLFSGDFLY